MKQHIGASIFFILVGVFTITCAVKDWNWFMENHKARFFVALLGRSGARVFYIAIGLFLLWVGVMQGFAH